MAGWLIQGVRGEGKSLCAVYKAREYLEQGRVVATNLDLFLDELVPFDNEAIAYRLPDKPRLSDFHLIGSAYDPKYKGEDKNGLLILDELGTWLNSRSWKDKERGDILNWLFLSRKMHWDIILLAQDHEMIDKQAKSTLCDYLVQASRTDRMKVPYIGRFLDKIGIDGNMPKEHVYEVFYGFQMSTNSPVETWRFKGNDLYDGYDTNQLFTDGHEVIEYEGEAKIVDFRTTYTHLPSSYLSGHFYKKPFSDELNKLTKVFGGDMALRSNAKGGLNKIKLVALVVLAVGFMGYRLFSGVDLPSNTVENVPGQAQSVSGDMVVEDSNSLNERSMVVNNSNYRLHFVDKLLLDYKPRLSTYAYSNKRQFGTVQFYQGNRIVESFTISELHALGVGVVHQEYGVDLVTDTSTTVVTSWAIYVEPEEDIEAVVNPNFKI